MSTPLVRHLNKIKELRFEHTRRFARCDFTTMPGLDTKIRDAWVDYHFAKDCAINKEECFNCAAPFRDDFTVLADGRKPMFFCSALCRETFGVSLGLT